MAKRSINWDAAKYSDALLSTAKGLAQRTKSGQDVGYLEMAFVNQVVELARALGWSDILLNELLPHEVEVLVSAKDVLAEPIIAEPAPEKKAGIFGR